MKTTSLHAVGLAGFLLIAGSLRGTAQITNSYQDGVGGYAGTAAVSIGTEDLGDTASNGDTWYEGDETDGELPLWNAATIGYDQRVLVRFGNLNLPAGATVQSATLQISVENYDSTLAITGYYLAAAWNPLSAPSHQGLGWLYRDQNIPWMTPGATGSGSDIVAGKSFSMSGFTGPVPETVSVALDPTVVQSWAQNTNADQGVLLVDTAGSGTRVYAPWYTNASVHPQLSILYLPPGTPPGIAHTAAITPNPVTSQTAQVSVLGSDPSGEAGLQYTWEAVSKPGGAADPQFVPNGVNAAKNSTVTFAQAGAYVLDAVVRNPIGLDTNSQVAVTVNQTYSQITVTPNAATIPTNSTLAFVAAAADQFGQPLPTQPSFIWSVSGGGTVDPTGLFTAGDVPGGPFQIVAQSGSMSATGLVTVAEPPVVSLTSPLGGQTFAQPANVALSASVEDSSGAVTNVQFFADDNLLAESANAPCSFVWTNPPLGTHNVFAVAYDNAGLQSSSATVDIFVGAAPNILPAPAQVRLGGAIASGGNAFNLQWHSQDGGLYQVQYSSNLANWATLPPLFLAPSTNAVWSDDGSLTGSIPGRQAARYYRLLIPGTTYSVPTGSSVSFLPTQTGSAYLWNFGDGTTSSAANPTHVYTAEGPQTITLTVTDGSGPHTITTTVGVDAPCHLFLTPEILAGLRQKALLNTVQWQTFTNQLDANLNQLGSLNGAYEGSDLPPIADYALGYQILKNIDPVTAASYADKAIAIVKSGLNDFQKFTEMANQYLVRGDGVTTTFTLPNADFLPSTLQVFTSVVNTVAVTRDPSSTADEVDYDTNGTFGQYETFLKVSKTSDGNPDYQPGTDWRRNGTLPNDMIDWSGASNAPAPGSTYYVTVAVCFDPTGNNVAFQQTTDFTLNGNQVTFASPPSSGTAIYVQYIYGTHTTNYATLAWQQTSADDGGFNSIFIDTGYTARYLGKYESLGYDWLYGYPGYSPALKTEAATTLTAWCDYWQTNGYYHDSLASNYGDGGYASCMFTALALAGGRDANGPRLTNEMFNFRLTNAIPLLTTPTNSLYGGFWAEGWDYGVLAAENLLLGGLAMESAGDGTADAEHQWAGQVINSLISIQPTPDTIYDGGDWYAYPAPFVSKELLYVLGTVSTNATAKSYANYIIQNYSGDQTADMLDLLFRDPAAMASFWPAEPLQNYAQGTGLITARADWTYQSPWVAFQLGNLLNADHQTFAQGQLQIQNGADNLLINPTAVTGFQDQSAESSFANLVAIDDNGAGTQNYPFNEGFWYGDPGCSITSYEAAGNYVYGAGDYAAAYSLSSTPGTGTANQLTRQVIYWRPNLLVVHDRAGTVAANDPKELRWHFLNRPVVNTNANSWVATAGSSKLFGQTFSGTALVTTNEPEQTESDGLVFYRVSTDNAANASSIRYTTALEVAPASTSTMLPAARVASTDNRMEGVLLGTNLVMFGTDSALTPFSGTISYAISSTSTVSHLLTDLQPNRIFQLQTNGVPHGTVTASAQGTLQFTTASGSQSISLY